jgi:ABC-type antimicrobial peptide transport system permease subunit
MISVFLRHISDFPGAYTRISKALQDHKDLGVFPFFGPDLGRFYRGSLSFLVTLSIQFVGLFAGVVGLALSSLFTITLSERASELGVMVSQGFPNKTLRLLAMREALLLTGLGLSLGGAIAAAVAKMINAANIRYHPAGLPKDIHFVVDIQPAVMVVIAACFAMTTYAGYRFLLNRHLLRSPIDLLKSASNLS